MVTLLSFMSPDLASPEVWLSLLTLTFLEIVLGIDNVIFISIAVAKLPKKNRPRARIVGLSLAMVLRIALLLGISLLIAMKEAWFSVNFPGFHGSFSGQSLILIGGGLFLLYKSVSEIHLTLEGKGHAMQSEGGATFTSIIIQILLIDLVFSFDSILTAVGMTSGIQGALIIMIVAVVISVIIMMMFATPVGNFVNRHPTIQMLCLSFLILIGFMLITEGAHLAHVTLMGQSIGAIPKGYLYFSIAFALGVEYLNMKLRKRVEPVQLHGVKKEAIEKGVIHED